MYQVYRQLAEQDGVSLESSPHNTRHFSATSLSGDYRRLVLRPSALAWRLLRYDAPDAELANVPPEGVLLSCYIYIYGYFMLVYAGLPMAAALRRARRRAGERAA